MSKRTQPGYSLVELLIVLAIIGLFLGIALPSFHTMRRRAGLRVAAAELRGIFHSARQRAITRNAKCGVKFFLAGGEWHYSLYDDGDRDGVRSDDIARGIDTPVTAPRPAIRETDAVTIGLLKRRIKDPDGERLNPDRSPVQFGRSDICSFTPMGESTPGTIYLTDRGSDLYALRVYGMTAKIRTLRYDAAAAVWAEK